MAKNAVAKEKLMTLYTANLCEPCQALKEWLKDSKISFYEINIRALSPREIKTLERNVRAVSRAGKLTVPAARITVDGKKTWVSNHGERDVTEMIEEIKKLLEL